MFFSYSPHSNFCITSECFRRMINSQSHVLFRFRPAMMYVSVPHSLRVANGFARLASRPSWSTASRWTWKRPATAMQRKDGASRPLSRCLNSSQGRFRARKLIGKEIGSSDIFGGFMGTNCVILGLELRTYYLFHRAQQSDLHQRPDLSSSDNVSDWSLANFWIHLGHQEIYRQASGLMNSVPCIPHFFI